MIRINNTQYFHFLQQADTLRRTGSFCDAIISVKSQTFRAHRLVLACASRTLAQQLAQGDIESPAHCTLEYFSPRIFQQVLDFTYTQTLEVSVEDLRQLLSAAQLLEMRPLEEQCLKQLDALECRVRADEEEDKHRESSHVKEEKNVAEHADLKKGGSPALEEKRRETSSPKRKTDNNAVTENVSPPATPRKKPRLPSAPEAVCNRDSAVTRPALSAPSLSSRWTFYPSMWSVNSLRQLINYPNPIAYPITMPVPRVFPLLGPHFQPSPHGSTAGYPGLHPRCLQNPYAEPAETERVIKQGLLRRKRPGQRVLAGMASSGELSYPEVPKSSTGRAKECKYCSTRLLGDSGPRDSSTTSPAGEACAECSFSGRRDVAQCEPQSIRQDHRGEKPYQCQHCPKKFSLKHQLDTHHRVHTGEKPFECRLCNQRSRDYSAMIKHLRTHGGASPYRCTVCLEFCSSLVAMQRHIKNHTTQDFPPNWNISSTYLYISHV